jgi:hypothetical protein
MRRFESKVSPDDFLGSYQYVGAYKRPDNQLYKNEATGYRVVLCERSRTNGNAPSTYFIDEDSKTYLTGLFYITQMSDGSAMYEGDIQSTLGRWNFNVSVIDKDSMLIYLK